MNWTPKLHSALVGAAVFLVSTALACSDEEDPVSLFVSKVEASQNITAKVSYLARFGSLEAVVTVAQQPPDRRVDLDVPNEGGGSTRDILISRGEESFACDSSSQQCYSSVQLDDEYFLRDFFEHTLGFRDAAAREGADGWTVSVSHSRVIAGENADCFIATPIEPSESWEGNYCFSREGILLASSFQSDSVEASMVALDLTKELTGEYFELPYPLVETGPE